MGHYVLTAIGRDRPGIVERLSGFLLERGANIEDSRMATLGGEFTVMLLFAAEADRAALIEADLSREARLGDLTLHVRATTAPSARPRGPAIPLRIEARALDHPGIVHEVARLLHGLGVNIEALETRVTQAPVSGSPIFEMSLDVSVPAETRLGQVRGELTALAERLNLDLTVRSPSRPG